MSLAQVSPSTWITAGVLAAGLIGNWYLMQNTLDRVDGDLQRLQSDYSQFRIDYASKESREDAADELLEFRVDKLEAELLK